MGIKKGKIGLEGGLIKEVFINVIEYNNLYEILRYYQNLDRAKILKKFIMLTLIFL